VPSEQGQSAVVVPAPAVEPVVAAWRQRFDSSAAQGMPAHITALYPFLPEERLTDDVVSGLRVLCAAVPILDVRFRCTGRFPDVLYLDPEPPGGLQALTTAIAERWPEAPPYGGAFDAVIPHLTIAHRAGDDVMNNIEADVQRRLPIETRLVEACMYVFDGQRWRLRARLPFQGRRSEQ
jgi:2'-5' RNA ligase